MQCNLFEKSYYKPAILIYDTMVPDLLFDSVNYIYAKNTSSNITNYASIVTTSKIHLTAHHFTDLRSGIIIGIFLLLHHSIITTFYY